MKTTVDFSSNYNYFLTKVNCLVEEVANYATGSYSEYYFDGKEGGIDSGFGDIWRFTIDGRQLVFEAISSRGNGIEIKIVFDSEDVYATFWGRRHALFADSSNQAGYLFSFLFKEEVEIEGGFEYHLKTGLLKSGVVMEYDSARSDANWWEFGLTPPNFPKPRFTDRASFKDWVKSLPENFPELLAKEKAMEHIAKNPSARWNICGPRGDIEDAVNSVLWG